MSILVYRDKSIAGAAAATMLAAAIIEKPTCAIGFDYANELVPVYRALTRMSADGLLDWTDVKAFMLSEQVQVDADRSIAKLLAEILLDRSGQREENRFAPETGRGDWSKICNDFETAILEAGGLDLAFLTVRADGSVCNNFAGSELAPVTHVERTEQGRIVTVGLSTLMAARKLVVLISGEDKATVSPALFRGPISPAVPASYLQLHTNAVFILDEEAAAHI